MHMNRPLPLRYQVSLFSYRIVELQLLLVMFYAVAIVAITVIAVTGWLLAGWPWPPLGDWFSFDQPLPIRLVVCAWLLAPCWTIYLADDDHPLWWLPYSVAALLSWALL
ncbi:hypothetical protein [Aquitalea palustris]|uniref:hypothetical protein n=1 Tax=Aquitalea palustris TaxID=2480983 RepID=UPI001CF00761|nr:hypothetical protein [Aquitalea palustris]